MPSNDITFCNYLDCKFYKHCRRYSYNKSDKELEYVSMMNFIPKDTESDNPIDYCEFFLKKGDIF